MSIEDAVSLTIALMVMLLVWSCSMMALGEHLLVKEIEHYGCQAVLEKIHKETT